MMLSSGFPDELAKYESSIANAFPLAGESGVPACDLPPLVGLASSFIAFSKAIGRLWAPGGFCFLLGLP